MEKPEKLDKKCLMPTIGQLPTSYLMSMSYEEQLLWLLNYLDKTVIPTLNRNSEITAQVIESFLALQNEFNEYKTELNNEFNDYKTIMDNNFNNLQSYVNNYFENLDVQEEINNKMNELIEQGVLPSMVGDIINGNNFSSNELNTHRTWTDGKEIYRKVIEVDDNIPLQENMRIIPHGIVNLSQVTSIKCISTPNSDDYMDFNHYTFDSQYGSNIDSSINTMITSSDILIIYNGMGNVNFNRYYIVIEYTKSS